MGRATLFLDTDSSEGIETGNLNQVLSSLPMNSKVVSIEQTLIGEELVQYKVIVENEIFYEGTKITPSYSREANNNEKGEPVAWNRFKGLHFEDVRPLEIKFYEEEEIAQE